MIEGKQQTLTTDKPKNLGMTLLLYLLGLFMGALDTGIVSPARGVIQNQLGVNETTGIWMITIFTLAYATSIPISGKLADRYGRKNMYLVSIALFGIGSLICSFSASSGGFAMLLVGRVIQALGGGGIMPIVTAEIGTSFPPEKRGMALGMVGGVYGIANVLGASAGTFILGLAGNSGWHWLFLINVPISLFIVVGAIFTLENHRAETSLRRMDTWGSVLLTGMILSLMYALTNIEFFDFLNSLTSLSVFPFLILFVLLVPVFILVELRAEDPILPMKYFRDGNMVITFISSLLVGTALMGMVFVPQFAENALKMPTGTGGYFVTGLGLFAGIGAMLSGRLIDRFGAKIVLIGGFGFTLISGLFLAFVATQTPTMPAVLTGLFLMGCGMGFTMGTPLNYMVLSIVPKEESSSALSTLSLIRSIGTAISPALMIGFIANAGAGLQTTLMDALPMPPSSLEIRQVEELKPLIKEIQENPELAKNVPAGMLDIDKMMAGNNASFDMTSGDASLPDDLLNDLQSADVTNIVVRVKNIADYMYQTNVTPDIVNAASGGVQKGIDGMRAGLSEMDKARVELEARLAEAVAKKAELDKGIADMNEGIQGVRSGIEGLGKAIAGMDKGINEQKSTLDGMYKALAAIKASAPADRSSEVKGGMPADMPAGMTGEMPAGMTGEMPAGMTGDVAPAMSADALQAGISGLESARKALLKKRDDAVAQKAELEMKLADMLAAQDGMSEGSAGLEQAVTGMREGLVQMEDGKALIERTVAKMTEVRDAVPGAFERARTDYLASLDKEGPVLESLFQKGLNGGFHDMYLMVSILAAFAVLVLLFYRERRAQMA